jgi:tetratricopeptide (TPR) repeat protein
VTEEATLAEFLKRLRRSSRAEDRYRLGVAALDDRRLDDAIGPLREAAEAMPDRWEAWFDLGLAYKLRREWAASVAANRRAAAIDPRREESHYNLGVAATAIRDWESAMDAWHGLGLDVGPGPIPDGDFGPCPVRLNPDTDGEVVWGRRIDPCRMRLESVPLPESGHRWHDVVLHDVVPVGRRMLGDASLPVFEELLRMDPSDASTFEVQVHAGTAADLDALAEASADAALGFEDWGSSIRLLCAACSRGEVHQEHDTVAAAEGWLVERRLGMAGDEDGLRSLLAGWSRGGAGRVVVEFERVA